MVTQKNTTKKKASEEKKSVSEKKAQPKKKKLQKMKLLRGMRDVLPQEQVYTEYILEAAAQVSRAYGYDRIDVPVVEMEELFVRTVGLGTDVVDKEMYSFTTKGGDEVALRPEFTAGIIRSYIEHGMMNLPKPVKLWTSGALFRYDRPQAGRYRQFNQLDWEIIGSDQPALDAEVISLCSHLLSDIGLEIMTQVNSIGCRDCRPNYILVLKDYYKANRKNLCEDCKIRLNKNPLRLLDCKEEACRAISGEAPQSIDHVCDNCKDHFMKVLEYLDEGDITYHLEPRLVRGLDYYSRTAFEFILKSEQEETHPTSLGGGGRYDYLVEDLGGAEPTPAVGVALGIERIVLALKSSNVEVSSSVQPDVFLAQIGETARKRAFKLLEELRKEGIAVASNISKNKLSDQLSLANKAEAKITLILGQKEMIDNTIIVRDMESNSQESIVQSSLIATLKKRLNS